MIALFTDFGWSGPYVGQLHAVLAEAAPGQPVIDLMHDAPRFEPVAAAHLLAAIAPQLPRGTVFVAVIDPGVGTAREPVVVAADGRWFVGPANGLFDVLAARASDARWWRITRAPAGASATFHGRDLFTPTAAVIACGEDVPGEPIASMAREGAAAECAAVVYIDGFGNAMTGLSAAPAADATLRVAGQDLPGGRTFADVPAGAPLWLMNSLGRIEIALHQGDAAAELGLTIGATVEWRMDDE